MIKMITEKDALIEKYNECMLNIASDQANILFFKAKAALFKERSPDNISSLERVRDIETSLYYYKIYLKELKALIDSKK